MGKMKVLLTAIAAIGLMLGLAGIASAATISCGQCHGTTFNNASTGTSGSVSYDMRNTGAAAPYESHILPQNDNFRGLHGIHMNYSSASFPTGLSYVGYSGANAGKSEPQTVTVTGPYAGTYGPRGVCQECHAANHPNHESGFLQWSTTSSKFSTPDPKYDKNWGWPTTKGYMLFSSNAGGMSNRPNSIVSMGITTNANGTSGYCTKACHKGTSSSNPAPWGNYTSANIVLSCSSCHGDASNNGATNGTATTGYSLSAPLGYGHKIHLNSYSTADDWVAGGIKIVLGNNSGMLYDRAAGGNTDAACLFCHPAPVTAAGVPTEGKTKLDWGPGGLNPNQGKAYPHAVDGTNVVSANVPANGQIGGWAGVALTLGNQTGTYSGTTCSSACHTNPSAGSLYETSNPGWNGKFATGGGCDLCHNHQFSASVNEAAGRALSYAHTLHFLNLSSPTHHGSVSCSASAPGTIKYGGENDTGYGCHVNGSLHTNINGVVNLIQLPVKNGAAGIDSTNNLQDASTGSAPTGPDTHVTCQNSCHVTRSQPWDSIGTNSTTATLGCAGCHEYPGGGRAQTSTGNPITAGVDWASTNGHSVRAAFNEATSVLGLAGSLKHLSASYAYNAQTDTYPAVTSDPTKCGKCHYGIPHMANRTTVQAYTGGSTLIQGKAATGFTVINHTPGSSAQCSNAKCHFNRTTPNWY